MLDRNDLHKLARAVAWTREREIGCDECFARMDLFAEIQFSGPDAATAMPQVQDHLRNCDDCREKYEALRIAIGVRQGYEPKRLDKIQKAGGEGVRK